MSEDIVVDSCFMKDYGTAGAAPHSKFFEWLRKYSVLVVNQKLLNEYVGSGNRLVVMLFDELHRDQRVKRIAKEDLNAFAKRDRFNYHCNAKDIVHAHTVFLSVRKRLVSRDKPLVRSVNEFPRVKGVKPTATEDPVEPF